MLRSHSVGGSWEPSSRRGGTAENQEDSSLLSADADFGATNQEAAADNRREDAQIIYHRGDRKRLLLLRASSDQLGIVRYALCCLSAFFVVVACFFVSFSLRLLLLLRIIYTTTWLNCLPPLPLQSTSTSFRTHAVAFDCYYQASSPRRPQLAPLQLTTTAIATPLTDNRAPPHRHIRGLDQSGSV